MGGVFLKGVFNPLHPCLGDTLHKTELYVLSLHQATPLLTVKNHHSRPETITILFSGSPYDRHLNIVAKGYIDGHSGGPNTVSM